MSHSRESPTSRAGHVARGVWWLLLGVQAVAGLLTHRSAAGADAGTSPPRFEDFVGAETCGRCHARELEAWRVSTHGRAGGAPGEVERIAPFDGEPLVFRDAVVVPRLGERGAPVFEVRQKGRETQILEVVAIVGGGFLVGGGNQAYFAAFPDGTVRFLPFDYSARQGWFVQRRGDLLWVPITRDLPLGAADSWPPHRILGNDPLSNGCLDCHGSQIQYLRDSHTGRGTTRWRSLAINCESCHGPGRRHVEIMESPDAASRAEIGMVPLELLSEEASLRTCLACHADKLFLIDGYLPGADLEEHFSLKLGILRHQTFTPDGKVTRFGYQDNQLLSDCTVNGSMVCTDCHDPHSQGYRDIWGRPLEGRFDDGQCTGCHPSKLADPSAHTHHAAGSAGSRCIACHMPFLQQKGIGTYVTYERSDHTVSIPRPARDASFGIEGACQKCHADREVAALQAAWERWWAPVKPSGWYVDAILRAKDAQDLRAAAELLLRPDAAPPSGQLLALSTLLEQHLVPDMTPLDPELRRRLEALAASEDLDVAATALASLHLAAGSDAEVRVFLTQRLEELGVRRSSVQARWALVLEYLSRLYASQRQAERARRVQAKLAALAAGTEP